MKRFYVLLILSIPALVFSQKITIGSGAELNIVGHNSANPTYTTTVDCDGDIEVQGVLDLDFSATLEVGGDFVSNTAGTNIQRGNSTVVFDGTAAQQIRRDVASNSAFGFYNMIVNNAAGVTIDNTYISSLTIYNVLTPQAGAFSTGDVLILNALSPTNFARVAYGLGDIVGDVTVEKRLSSTNAGWRQLSMPLNEQWQNGDWTGISLLFDGHTPANQINVFSWFSGQFTAPDYARGWIPGAPGQLGLTSARAVYLNGSSSIHSVSQTFSCRGALNDNAASIGYALSYTRDPQDLSGSNPAAKGWNFIANPWAAFIDVQTLLTSTSFNAFEPSYKAVHVYNSLLGQYQAILLDNTVTKQVWNTNGPDIENADANIPPFQAFWVKADAPGQAITLYRDEMQTVNAANSLNEQFMKKTPDVLRLNVFDKDSLWDQLVVYFDEGKTRNFDMVGDAYYMYAPDDHFPVFYALEDNISASMVGRQPDMTDSVEVVFGSAKEQSTFYLHSDLDELPADWYVYLRDRKTHKTYKLEHGKSLAFAHQYGLKSNRFVIYYSKNANAFEHLVTGEQTEVIASIRQNQLVLDSYGVGGAGEVAVFDAVGRLMFNQPVNFTPGEALFLDMPQTGNLVIVDVTVNGEHYIRKVFF